MSIYLDNNATSPIRPEAKAAMIEALDAGGNASSVHAVGRAARVRIERAREQVAGLVNCVPGSVTFTSGGTEANALAIESAKAAGFERIIIGATEHDSIRENAKASGLTVEVWPVDGHGVADTAWLKTAVAAGGKALVCLMLANNETGVIQPVTEASALVCEAGGWLHVDAIQAAGKIAIDFSALGADTLSLSAHKLGGPQGVGALVAGTRATLARRQHGGGQERGRRAGTENGPGIAGFGAAAAQGVADDHAAWRDAFAAQAKAAGAVILGEGADRLPQTLCLALPGYAAELQVMGMDLAGVMISAGSACSSGKVKASHVVEAMGRADLAPYAIRLSGGWASSEDDWISAAKAWAALAERHQARRKAVA
ncbi:MAG: cysteine desulfurase family protein [Caulobacteraceae bacterium]